MIRDSIDIYYMKMAYLVSERSTCTRRNVGSIIARDKIVLSTGYNGSVSGGIHCTKSTCLRIGLKSGERLERCRSGHAESNAIANAAKNGVNINGSTLYCTTQPCSYCAKLIVNAGIKRIVFCEPYGNGFDELTREILKDVEVNIINKENIFK